jgi:hypothetical protein
MLCATIRLLRLGSEGDARPPRAVSFLGSSRSGDCLLFVICSAKRLTRLSAEVILGEGVRLSVATMIIASPRVVAPMLATLGSWVGDGFLHPLLGGWRWSFLGVPRHARESFLWWSDLWLLLPRRQWR